MSINIQKSKLVGQTVSTLFSFEWPYHLRPTSWKCQLGKHGGGKIRQLVISPYWSSAYCAVWIAVNLALLWQISVSSFVISSSAFSAAISGDGFLNHIVKTNLSKMFWLEDGGLIWMAFLGDQRRVSRNWCGQIQFTWSFRWCNSAPSWRYL